MLFVKVKADGIILVNLEKYGTQIPDYGRCEMQKIRVTELHS